MFLSFPVQENFDLGTCLAESVDRLGQPGAVLFDNVIVDDQDGGTIVNVTIALKKKRNVTLSDWFGVVSLPNHWKTSYLRATKGCSYSCTRQPRRLWYWPNATKAGGWWILSQVGCCDGIGHFWTASVPRALIPRRAVAQMAAAVVRKTPQSLMEEGPPLLHGVGNPERCPQKNANTKPQFSH